MLRSPKAWGPLFAVVVLAFFYFLVNFGAAKGPDTDTHDLPAALVNQDTGAEIGGQMVNFGDRVLESTTSSDQIGEAIKWTKLPSRGEALEGIADGEYYGAIVVPEDYSQTIATLSTLSADSLAESARIEILTNSSAGPFSSAAVQQILAGVVRRASEVTSDQITGALEASDAQVPPATAAVLGEPVVAEITDAQPVSENSGRGLIFYDGRLEAGLSGTLWTLAAYLVDALLLGGAISLARDAIARRQGAVREGSPWDEAVATEGVTRKKGGFGRVQ